MNLKEAEAEIVELKAEIEQLRSHVCTHCTGLAYYTAGDLYEGYKRIPCHYCNGLGKVNDDRG